MGQKILIIGGGFGGVRAALDLARAGRRDLALTLVSERPNFEYQPALYRVVTGAPARETAIPLAKIFKHLPIRVVIERIGALDLTRGVAHGEAGQTFEFDHVVLALGSESAYFNIAGLEDNSFTFKTTEDALGLKRHLANMLRAAAETGDPATRALFTKVVLVGGGPVGVELAGELGYFMQTLAKRSGVDPQAVTIDLIEGAPSLLAALPPRVAWRVEARLRRLGVQVILNQALKRTGDNRLEFGDLAIKTRTLIWTAGLKPHSFHQQIAGLTFDKRGRVIVNDWLEPAGFTNCSVVGDGAAIPFVGMAQTAIQAGRHAARLILAGNRRATPPFRPRAPVYAVPVGRHWAAVTYHGWSIFGWLGWLVRRAADFDFFLSILPFRSALRLFYLSCRSK